MCFPAIAAALPAVFGGAAAGTAATAGAVTASSIGGSAALAAGATAAGTATAAGMTTAQMVALGLSAAGTGISALGAYNQAQTGKAVAEANAKNAEIQAQDALRRGEKDAMELRQRASAYKSAQRVAMAKNGLDLTYGTAADLQDQTDFFGQADMDTARSNARREAWARQSQSANFQMEAAASRPWLAGGSTLLAGAGSVASKWYDYRGR